MTLNLSHFNVSIPLGVADGNYLDGFRLLWRQHKLIVRSAPYGAANGLPPLPNVRSLIQCLQRSPIQLVLLDPTLGSERLGLWAEACYRAHKPAYLQIPSSRDLPQFKHPHRWFVKRVFDWLAAIVLLGLLSPLLVGIAVVLFIEAPGPVLVRHWQISQRGKLFPCYYFRTMMVENDSSTINRRGNHPNPEGRSTGFGQFLCRYRLHKLPHLIHVLRGEMSLIGPRSYRLEDVAKMNPAARPQLNALPGMIGAYPAKVQSNFPDLMTVNQNALNYLRSWSLGRDLKALFSSISRVLLAS